MFWECSECGHPIEGRRPPVVCPSCGTAGVLFARVERDDVDEGSWRDLWIRSGIDRARPAALFAR